MLRKLLVFLASPTLATLLISACAEVVPLANSPSLRTVATPTPESTPTPDVVITERLFRNDPTVVTLVDVALAFAYFQRSDATPEQIIESINTLTNENLSLADFDSPFPIAADVAVFASPPDVLTLEDVAALFVVFQGFTERDEAATAIANLIPGFDPADLIRVPGSTPTVSPSPTVVPPPPPAAPAPVAGFSASGATLTGSTIAIGSLIGAEGTATITISETGNAELIVSAAVVGDTDPAQFAVVPSAITIANGGAAEPIEISCTPKALGVDATAQLELKTNDPNNLVVSYDLECRGLSDVVRSTDDNTLETLAADLTTCTLREAIAANIAADAVGGCANPGSTINFAPTLTGTIKLEAALPQINSGITITGPGRDQLTISGDGKFRVFDINAGTDPVTIAALTLTQGLATNSSGGAIRSSGSGLLTIDSVTITNSEATDTDAGSGRGGGIFATNVKVSTSTLSGNRARRFGGGIYAVNTAIVSTSTLSGNGGLAREGGGIFAEIVTVNNSTISGNTASDEGGGILAINVANVSNSTLSGNRARRGGGIYAYTANVSNSTLSGNTAIDGGGGILATNMAVSNSTIVLNRSDVGGGISLGTVVSINNTIVAGNTNNIDTSANNIGGGAFVSGSNNLIGSGLSSYLGGLSAFTLNSFINADYDDVLATILGDLADNGGPTPTHALKEGTPDIPNPAIDAGDSDLAVDVDGTTELSNDQRGTGFTRILGSFVDIGAFEAIPLPP